MIQYEDIAKILHGIDMDECENDDGWWETSTGAEYGASVLAEIKALFEEAGERKHCGDVDCEFCADWAVEEAMKAAGFLDDIS